MRFDKMVYCEWENIKDFPARYIDDDYTVSVVIDDYELMMFLTKINNHKFEARVYKKSAEHKYEPKFSDEAVNYEENDEYISFFFDNFYAARRFLDYIPYSHKEFRERPARKCSNENSIKYDNDICAISCR